jgi:hypothetical protein
MFMPTNKLDGALRTMASVFLAASLLAACAKPAPPPETAPAQTSPPIAPATPDAPPPAETLPAPDGDPAAPAQPAPDAPPPTEPSAAPTPTAANEPSLESMNVATPSAKMSVSVDLRYSFDSAALPGQPVTLHLAAVPRVNGSNLRVSVKEVAGVQLASGPLNLQKTNGPDVYRQQISVTRSIDSPRQLRVLVTMDYASGSGFGFFSVPFDAGTNAQKQDSVKQR